MAQTSELERFRDDGSEIDFLPVAFVGQMARFASLQNLLDGAEQAIGIFEHDPIELTALRFIDRAGLQSLEIETNAGDWRFEFVRDGVEEAVLAFIATNFAHDEDC